MLKSEQATRSAASFRGSASRLWQKLVVDPQVHPAVRWGALLPLALLLITTVWMVVAGYWLLLGVVVWPFHAARRARRRQRIEQLRHREVLAASGPRSVPSR